jgi:hypothetical protein
MMMSLNRLVQTGEGLDYIFADFTNWAAAVGFCRTEIIPLAGTVGANDGIGVSGPPVIVMEGKIYI